MKPSAVAEPSIAALLGSGQLAKLPSFISEVRGDAEKIVAHGDFVRAEFQAGNLNSSRLATVEGSLTAARHFIPKIHEDREPAKTETPRFFGQNIREVVNAFRPLWRK